MRRRAYAATISSAGPHSRGHPHLPVRCVYPCASVPCPPFRHTRACHPTAAVCFWSKSGRTAAHLTSLKQFFVDCNSGERTCQIACEPVVEKELMKDCQNFSTSLQANPRLSVFNAAISHTALSARCRRFSHLQSCSSRVTRVSQATLKGVRDTQKLCLNGLMCNLALCHARAQQLSTVFSQKNRILVHPHSTSRDRHQQHRSNPNTSFPSEKISTV